MIKLNSIIIAFFVSLALGIGLLLVSSDQPGQVLEVFFTQPFSNMVFFSPFLSSFALILLCSLGFSIAFKAGLFNLGGGGQIAVGGIAAALFALASPNLAFPFSVVIGGTIAFLVAGLVGVVIALMKVYVKISEVISSFLLSLGIIAVSNFLISHALRDTTSQMLKTSDVGSNFFLPSLFQDSHISLGIVGSLAVAAFVWLILRHSLFGYDLRTLSNNAEFAKSQGIPIGWRIVVTFALSAGFHGLAGATFVYDTHHAAYVDFGTSLAWAGVSAALLSRGHPLGTILGSFVIAYIDAGTKAVTTYSSISNEVGILMQAVFFIFITIQTGRHKHA